MYNYDKKKVINNMILAHSTLYKELCDFPPEQMPDTSMITNNSVIIALANNILDKTELFKYSYAPSEWLYSLLSATVYRGGAFRRKEYCRLLDDG